MFFGFDRWYWFIPTHPCLKVNYLEKMYTRTQLRQIIRDGRGFEEDEWDLNKKNYIIELRKSNLEKRLALLWLIIVVLMWFFVIQPRLIAPYLPQPPLSVDPQMV